jgi:hypothetical protein
VRKYHLARARQYEAQIVSYEFALEADLSDPYVDRDRRVKAVENYGKLIADYREMAEQQRRFAAECEEVL